MGRPRKPARLVEWRRGEWYVFWTDPRTGKAKRERCAAHGANDKKARKKLVERFLRKEADGQAEVRRRGGTLAYDTPLLKAIDQYEADVTARVKIREANPESREGLSPASGKEISDTIQRFRDWLKSELRPNLTTGAVDAPMLRRFFQHLATEKTRQGSKGIIRSTQTVNKHRRHLRACFRWLDTLRPPLFPDFDALAPAFKMTPTDGGTAHAFPPDTLRRFLSAALDYEASDRAVEVTRTKREVVLPTGHRFEGGVETFKQRAPSTATTPISRLFLLLALTGCRLGEALALTWDDVDLQRGRITFRSTKTGRRRIVPLVGAPEGIIAPVFLDVIKRWRLEAGDRLHVLPHADNELAPHFSKGAWQAVNKLAELPRIGPQMLRQNFCAYAASLGVPAAVAALWQGHGAAVAERWYREQVLDREDGDTFEDAMGLTRGWSG